MSEGLACSYVSVEYGAYASYVLVTVVCDGWSSVSIVLSGAGKLIPVVCVRVSGCECVVDDSSFAM